MNYKLYDVIIVGCGFFGSVIAERVASQMNKKVLIIDKRNHIGGNCYSENDEETNINFHKYGTHIFHTSNELVWNYLTKFAKFNNYKHQVLTTFKNKVYQMPINLETINSFYNINLKPYEVKKFLKSEIEKENISNAPNNFEEKAISFVGRPLYEAFIKGYTIKQWQRHPKKMPESILTRLPFRTNYDECYFLNANWEGIPIGGYTPIFEKLLSHKNIDVKLNLDFFDIKDNIPSDKTLFYSGPIDKFFNYKYGKLDWRTLRFEKKVVSYEDYQGTAVMNYAEEKIPFTRIHEPKHLHPEVNNSSSKSLIIKEFSLKDDGSNPYYPISDEKNQKIVLKYRNEVSKNKNLFICGRLGDYKYYDMDKTIEMALETFEKFKTN